MVLMKVWLVKECYTGEGVAQESILGAYSSKEKAEIILTDLNMLETKSDNSEFYIEELEVE